MTARLPSVSVVVPTRDRPQLVRRAVAAILGQAYPGPVQCMVVFNQSDPNLPWSDPGHRRRLELVRNRRAAGLAGARNSGVLHADGELLAFCDDDDEWLPDKLRRQVEQLNLTPEAGGDLGRAGQVPGPHHEATGRITIGCSGRPGWRPSSPSRSRW
jgi:glycosyltransferase involved in cell wall biosynthesis